MKMKGSAKIQIGCAECRRESPLFRVYFSEDEYGDHWNGDLPAGWTCYDEVELTGKMVAGGCPEHAV